MYQKGVTSKKINMAPCLTMQYTVFAGLTSGLAVLASMSKIAVKDGFKQFEFIND